MIYIVTGTFTTTFAVNIVVSFILSGLAIAGLSGFHILDTGLNDSATWILFVLIFGACFYGVTVAGITFGSSGDSHLINGNELQYNSLSQLQADGWDVNNLPNYIKSVYYWTTGVFYNTQITIDNPNYDPNAPTNNTQLGFGISGNTGLGNEMFTDMPYFGFINLIFGVMYAFGLYLTVAHKG
jgi:hypothetical protein